MFFAKNIIDIGPAYGLEISILGDINKEFLFIYLLSFTIKCIGGQIKGFSFLFFSVCDIKGTKGGQR